MKETQSAPFEGEASIRHSSNTEGTESYDDSSSDTVRGTSEGAEEGADWKEDKSTAAPDSSEQYPGAKTDFGIRVASELIEEPEYSTFEFVRETVRG